MVVIMDRYKVTDLVNPDLPLLKMFFYQIDTLMGLVDASLHKHMKEEGLSATLFASKWFITVFTSVSDSITPSADDDTVNESLLQIWDHFLVKGWPALVKVSAYLLSSRREELKQKPLEEVLEDIQTFCKSDVLQASPTEPLFRKIKREFRNQNLSYHLSQLQSDFESAHSSVKSQPAKNKTLELNQLPRNI